MVRWLIEKIKSEGFRAVFYKSLRYVYRKFLFVYHDVVMFESSTEELKSHCSRIVFPRDELAVREATLDDLRSLSCFTTQKEKDAFLIDAEKRFSEGKKCFCAFLEGIPVFYGWVALACGTAPITEVDREYSVPQNAIYIYNCFTVPEYRGNKIYPRAILYMAKSFAATDIVQIGSLKHNIPSISAIRKLGFKEIGHFLYIKILGLHWTVASRSLK